MKKSHSFDDLSEKTCSCGQAIKTRLAERFSLCYNCYRDKESKRGHKINQQPRDKRIEAGLPVKQY